MAEKTGSVNGNLYYKLRLEGKGREEAVDRAAIRRYTIDEMIAMLHREVCKGSFTAEAYGGRKEE